MADLTIIEIWESMADAGAMGFNPICLDIDEPLSTKESLLADFFKTGKAYCPENPALFAHGILKTFYNRHRELFRKLYGNVLPGHITF